MTPLIYVPEARVIAISVFLSPISPAERGDSRQPLIRTIVRVADDVKHSACLHLMADVKRELSLTLNE